MAENGSILTLKNYFGYRDGDKASGFLGEIKALSADERAQLTAGIEDGTLDYAAAA